MVQRPFIARREKWRVSERRVVRIEVVTCTHPEAARLIDEDRHGIGRLAPAGSPQAQFLLLDCPEVF